MIELSNEEFARNEEFNTGFQHQNLTFAHLNSCLSEKLPNTNKPTTILFVVTINGVEIRLTTKRKVYPKYWTGNRAIINESIPRLDNINNKILNKTLEQYGMV